MTEKLLTIKQTAELIGKSVPTVLRYIKKGLMQTTKVGGSVYVIEESIRVRKWEVK